MTTRLPPGGSSSRLRRVESAEVESAEVESAEVEEAAAQQVERRDDGELPDRPALAG
jgi:hypothetical protein